MKNCKLNIASALVCFFCLAGIKADAHYMWFNVNDYTPQAARTANFSVGWGHHFYNPVGDILYGKEIIGDMYLLDAKGSKTDISSVNEVQYKSAGPLAKGTYLAVVQRKEGFSTKTTEGYKRQSKKGLKNVIHSRYIGMYAKAVINAGEPGADPMVKTPLGLGLEIVPLEDPAGLKAGDYLPFKLLAEGKPVAETVFCTYAGFSTEDDWAYTTRTDSKGIGKIKILNAGIWVMKANVKQPYPNPEEADEYSYTTSLSFEVR